MNDQASAVDRPNGARAIEFARTEMFERTFKEGMSLVEETAAYLDGPGRAASKRLNRAAALGYAGESMRLTTHLMQVASWLLVQRALRDGNMTLAEAADEKYRFSGRERSEAGPLSSADLPEDLRALIVRADGLYERVRRLDEKMYGWSQDAPANEVTSQFDRLRAAIDSGAFSR